MQQLDVLAIAYANSAADENKEHATIYLSVIASDGSAVENLSKDHIILDTIRVGAGGANIDIVQILRAGPQAQGLHEVEIKPLKGAPWKHGTYIIGVTIEKSNLRGQTMVTLEIN